MWKKSKGGILGTMTQFQPRKVLRDKKVRNSCSTSIRTNSPVTWMCFIVILTAQRTISLSPTPSLQVQQAAAKRATLRLWRKTSSSRPRFISGMVVIFYHDFSQTVSTYFYKSQVQNIQLLKFTSTNLCFWVSILNASPTNCSKTLLCVNKSSHKEERDLLMLLWMWP